MEWTQIIFLVVANASLILWFRAESRADWRHIDSKIDAMNDSTQKQLCAIQEEMKDFHGRLCSLEERRR